MGAPSKYLAGVRESQIADPFWGEKGFEIWILLWRLQRVGIMNASKDFIFWSCCKGFDFVNSVLNRIRIRKGSCQQHAKSPAGSRIRSSSTIWLRKFSMMWQFWTRGAPLLYFQTSKFNIFLNLGEHCKQNNLILDRKVALNSHISWLQWSPTSWLW